MSSRRLAVVQRDESMLETKGSAECTVLSEPGVAAPKNSLDEFMIETNDSALCPMLGQPDVAMRDESMLETNDSAERAMLSDAVRLDEKPAAAPAHDELSKESSISGKPQPALRLCAAMVLALSATLCALKASVAFHGATAWNTVRRNANQLQDPRELGMFGIHIWGTSTISTTTTVTTTITTTSTLTTTSSTTWPLHPPQASLFCFSLVLPWGSHESALLRWQKQANKSIFACDEHAIYSNTTTDEIRDLKPRIFEHDLWCPIGGAWHTRLNTWIFMKLWNQVWLDGQFRMAAWTVKVDPDAVFLPQRLRHVVGDSWHASAQEGNGMFSVNCEFKGTLHGAVEVLSRRALEVYATRNWPNCPRPLQEDYYLRECLNYLGVRQMNDFKLLAETYCTSDPMDCTTARVAFHPFKSLHSYQACVWRADHYGTWWG